MSVQASVIICSHNPRVDYLTRVLDALKAQTLPMEQWELLLIDNASADPIAPRFDLSWHPNARHVREDELGLTPARLRGIKEAMGEVLVFVDDDNVLDVDYLQRALSIGAEYPFLGAWGGDIAPEFESEPQAWTKSFWSWLAIRDVERIVWCNHAVDGMGKPYGAGLVIRAGVGRHYVAGISSNSWPQLGRRGSSLISGEDNELVGCCSFLNLGWGLFPELSVLHLIPSNRLSFNYLERLGFAMGQTSVHLTKSIDYQRFKEISKIYRMVLLVRIFFQKGIKPTLVHMSYQNGVLFALKERRNQKETR